MQVVLGHLVPLVCGFGSICLTTFCAVPGATCPGSSRTWRWLDASCSLPYNFKRTRVASGGIELCCGMGSLYPGVKMSPRASTATGCSLSSSTLFCADTAFGLLAAHAVETCVETGICRPDFRDIIVVHCMKFAYCLGLGCTCASGL